jgi:hypothetical protein
MNDDLRQRSLHIGLAAILALAGCGGSRSTGVRPQAEAGSDATTMSDASKPTDAGMSVDAPKSIDGNADVTSPEAGLTCDAGVQFDLDAATPCTGVQVHAPSGFTNALVAGQPAGTTFCLNAGTYTMASSVVAKKSDKFIGVGAVTIDFGATPYAALQGQGSQVFGLYGFGGSTGQSGVTVKNLTVQNCDPRHQSIKNNGCIAIKEGSDWTVQNVEVLGSDQGVGGGCDHCYLHDNYTYGIGDFGGVSPSDPARVTCSEIASNGGLPDPGGSTGASKTVQLTYAVWDGDYVHDNLGPGFWCDGCWQGSQTLIQNSTFTNNQGPGIDWEISWGACPAPNGCSVGTSTPYIGDGFAIARNNTLTNNDTVNLGQSCFNSAQIQVQNSEGIEAYGNTIDSRSGVNAICVISTVRANSWPTYPETVEPFYFHDNTVHLATTALVGEAGERFPLEASPGHVWFDNNTYHEVSATEGHWEWLTSAANLTFKQWQSDGQDPSGSLNMSP